MISNNLILVDRMMGIDIPPEDNGFILSERISE